MGIGMGLGMDGHGHDHRLMTRTKEILPILLHYYCYIHLLVDYLLNSLFYRIANRLVGVLWDFMSFISSNSPYCSCSAQYVISME